jgi:hypothetical protein
VGDLHGRDSWTVVMVGMVVVCVLCLIVLIGEDSDAEFNGWFFEQYGLVLGC